MNKILSIVILSLFSLVLFSQEEISLNLNFSQKKADYLATVAVHEDFVYAATRQRDFEIDNETFLGLQITKMDLNGSIVWADSIIPTDINDLYLAEEANMIIYEDHIYSIYSIISDSPEKEFLFNKHTTAGERLISQRIAIDGDLSLVSGIVSFNDLIYVIQESNTSKLELLEFDENLNLMNSYAILAPIGNDFSLSSSEDYLIVSYSTWNTFNVDFNCKVYDKNLNTVESFNDFPISEISSQISASSSVDGGYIFSWTKDLSYALYDTFPYPTVVYKYNNELEQEWEYVFYHKSAKQFIGTFETEEGNIFGYGTSDELYTFDITPSPLNAYNAWCFLLSPNGELLWERAIFDERYMLLNGFFTGIEYQDHFILGGLVDEFDPNSNPINDPSSWLLSIDKDGCWNGNCEDIIIIENDSLSYTDVEDFSIPSIHIYPSPAIDIVNIKTPFQEFDLQLINAAGNTVITEKRFGSEQTLNMESQPSGHYYIVLFDAKTGRKYVERIVKM